jgi:hypothetical protein
MLPEKLRSIFRKGNDPALVGSPSAGRTEGAPQSLVSAGLLARRAAKKDPPLERQSRGLEQFFFNVRDVVGLSILDCAGANQENINFLVDLGHKIYSQDLVRSLDDAFGLDPSEQTNVSRID